ncbi:hypothetical protein [Aliihoeflea sp. PC F10.4]
MMTDLKGIFISSANLLHDGLAAGIRSASPAPHLAGVGRPRSA